MNTEPPHTIVFAVLVASTGAAAAIDIARRRIPNGLSLATVVAGVTLAASGLSGVPVWSSLAGLLLGFALMLPGHVFGATGAGDVKLFAAVGSLLGVAQTVQAFLFVAIAGGVLALAYACARGRLGGTVARTAGLLTGTMSTRAAIESPAQNNRFPYGPAIAAGSVIAMMW